MKLNNKGFSLVEMLVSISILSVVIIFMMHLFANIRNIYISNNEEFEYEILKSRVIKSISSDLNNNKLISYEKVNNKEIILHFESGSKNIKITDNNIRYYDENNEYLNETLPNESVVGNILINGNDLIKIHIPFRSNSKNYDINIYEVYYE